MIGLLQRVARADVRVGGDVVGEIGPGLAVLVGVVGDDDEGRADRLLDRVLGYRVFEDAGGRMNLSLTDVAGGLLLVPQFTLAADTRKGRRPSFSRAAPPAEAQHLFDYLVAQARRRLPTVQSGRFGAAMQVALVNDGPVTFWLES
ncbi:MAG: D-aminoacyl-tRNA deacylase [Gammaproteobacteria bacterium]|nr:D-aminoacyl-tRNA deacylase [Gammaproteobacteria bacterium]